MRSGLDPQIVLVLTLRRGSKRASIGQGEMIMPRVGTSPCTSYGILESMNERHWPPRTSSYSMPLSNCRSIPTRRQCTMTIPLLGRLPDPTGQRAPSKRRCSWSQGLGQPKIVSADELTREIKVFSSEWCDEKHPTAGRPSTYGNIISSDRHVRLDLIVWFQLHQASSCLGRACSIRVC